jgi:hypothetical protein
MAHWTFSIKFPYNTQFIFGSMMFTTVEDENLELLTRDPTPKHLASVYGRAPYFLTDTSTSGGACSDLNPYTGPYYRSTKTSRGLLIWKTILQPSAGASSSSSLGETPNRDSIEDYTAIGGCACWNPTIKAHRINMVGPARGNSQNSSNKYRTIGGSEAFDVRTPSSNIL